jgi:hypothetical protein
MEDLTDVVDRSLHSPDPPWGYGGSISIDSRAWDGWLLGLKGTFEGWDPVVCWVSGPEMGSKIWDPEAS